MIHIKSIRKNDFFDPTPVPIQRAHHRKLELDDVQSPVTSFVSENDSGKSTLLEAIAAKATLPLAAES